MVKFLQPIDGVDVQASFVKGPKEEKVIISYTPDGGMRAVPMTKFDELLAKVKVQTSTCTDLSGDKFDRCFTNGIAEDVITMEDKKVEVTKYRDLMASRLRNYTCSDETMNTSKPLYSTNIKFNNQSHRIDVMFNSPNAKIWVIENFISEKECQILEDHGRSRLARATVAGEDGQSIVSENRKAQQASYNMHQKHADDPLISLNDKVLAVTNSHAGHAMRVEGQEDFTIIQYNKDDQYTPHCDGNCDGSEYVPGGRVATAVMYCRVALEGGGTTFTKADVFVKPTKGMATFFSYKGTNGKMDDGFTEHSGCPVLKGEKWITTLWMREGVTRDDSWEKFDPSGIRLSSYDTEEYSEGTEEEEVGEEEEVSK